MLKKELKPSECQQIYTNSSTNKNVTLFWVKEVTNVYKGTQRYKMNAHTR